MKLRDLLEMVGDDRVAMYVRKGGRSGCAIKHPTCQFVHLDGKAIFIYSNTLLDYGRKSVFGPHKFNWHCENRGFNLDMPVFVLDEGRLVEPKASFGTCVAYDEDLVLDI